MTKPKDRSRDRSSSKDAAHKDAGRRDHKKDCSSGNSKEATKVTSTTLLTCPKTMEATVIAPSATVSPTKVPPNRDNELRLTLSFSKKELRLAMPLGSSAPKRSIESATLTPASIISATAAAGGPKESKVPEKVIVNIKSSTKDLPENVKRGPSSKKGAKVINVSVQNDSGCEVDDRHRNNHHHHHHHHHHHNHNNNNNNNIDNNGIGKPFCASATDSTKKCGGKLSPTTGTGLVFNGRDTKTIGDPLKIKWSESMHHAHSGYGNSVDIIKLPMNDSDSECRKVSSTTNIKIGRKSLNARDEHITSTSSQLERLSLDPLMMSKKYVNNSDAVSITLLNKQQSPKHHHTLSDRPPKKRSKLMAKHDEPAPVVSIANFMKDMHLGAHTCSTSIKSSLETTMVSPFARHSDDRPAFKVDEVEGKSTTATTASSPSKKRVNGFKSDMSTPTRYPYALNERPFGFLNKHICSFEDAIGGNVSRPPRPASVAAKPRHIIIPSVARNDPKMFQAYVHLVRSSGVVVPSKCSQNISEAVRSAETAVVDHTKESDVVQLQLVESEPEQKPVIDVDIDLKICDEPTTAVLPIDIVSEPILLETSVEEDVTEIVDLDTTIESLLDDDDMEVEEAKQPTVAEQCDEIDTKPIGIVASVDSLMPIPVAPVICVKAPVDDDINYDADDDDAPHTDPSAADRLVVVIKTDCGSLKSILHSPERVPTFKVLGVTAPRKSVTWSHKDTYHEYNVNAPTAEAPKPKRHSQPSVDGVVEPLVIRLPTMKICKDQKVPTLSLKEQRKMAIAMKTNRADVGSATGWETSKTNRGPLCFKLSRKKNITKYLRKKYGNRYFNAYVRLEHDQRIAAMLNEGRYAEQLPPELLQQTIAGGDDGVLLPPFEPMEIVPKTEDLNGGECERVEQQQHQEQQQQHQSSMVMSLSDDEAATMQLTAEFVSADTQMSPYAQDVAESEDDPLSTDVISTVLTPATVDSIAKIIESSVHMNNDDNMFLAPNEPDRFTHRIDLEAAAPLQEIQPDDIINVLGKETAYDATLSNNVQEDIDNHMDENAAKKIEETVRQMSPQSLHMNMSTGNNNNYFDILGNMNCLSQTVVRTKASLKQMVEPTADVDSFVQFGHNMVLENFHDLAHMAPPLSSQLIRNENPLLTNGHRMIDENSVDLSEGSSSPYGSTSSPYSSNCSPFGNNSPFGCSSPYTNSSPFPSSSPYANSSPYPSSSPYANSSPFPSSSPYTHGSPYAHGSPYPSSSPYGSSSPFTTDSSSLDHHPMGHNIVNHQLNVTFTTPSKQNLQFEDALLIEDIFINGSDTSSISETYTHADTQNIEKLRLELLGGID